MKLLMIIILFSIFNNLFAGAYHVSINNTNLISDASPSVKCFGNLLISENSELFVNSSATISLAGSWINNGDFISGNSIVRFFGNNETEYIQGNTVTTFSNLVVEKDDEDKTLSPLIDVFVQNDMNIIKGTLFVEDINVEIWNNLNIYNGGILENKSDLPFLIKIFGRVYNNSELNNDGWLEIGVEE